MTYHGHVGDGILINKSSLTFTEGTHENIEFWFSDALMCMMPT